MCDYFNFSRRGMKTQGDFVAMLTSDSLKLIMSCFIIVERGVYFVYTPVSPSKSSDTKSASLARLAPMKSLVETGESGTPRPE